MGQLSPEGAIEPCSLNREFAARVISGIGMRGWGQSPARAIIQLIQQRGLSRSSRRFLERLHLLLRQILRRSKKRKFIAFND